MVKAKNMYMSKRNGGLRVKGIKIFNDSFL